MTKILVIEDEQLLRENILELLEAEGFETIGAQNGHVGITWAWEHKPDLIICDVMMPELDGYEVLSLLRQEPATATMPFIFLTAKADKTSLRQGMEMGADDYLTKPFTKSELLGAIAARVKKQAALSQQTEQLLAELRRNIDEHSKYKSTNVFVNDLLALKPAKFTGTVLVKSSSGQEWTFYLYQGRILYVTGGLHPVRRWQRHLATFCPQIQAEQLHLPPELINSAWEYQALGLWLKQQQMSREQANKMIQAIVAEALFDILLAEQVIYQNQPENTLPLQLLLLIDVEQVLTTAQHLWQSWQTAKLTNLSPHKAPSLKRPEVLQQQTSAEAYQQLKTLLNGQRTLRDIAAQMKHQVWEVTSSLLPYIQTGIVELVDVPDLTKPMPSDAPPVQPIQNTPLKPKIACIDDSPLICQTMEDILTKAGYQFVAVQDPLRAIATLLSCKPDLIFLDLVMPHLNGYEICTRLRKISAFHHTPIVILSGNIVDRVRAKVVGASDCLDKPVKSETVLKLVSRYLMPAEMSEV